MKKLISVTLVLTMILTMCACGAKKDDANSGAETSEAVSSENASSEEVAAETASSEEAGSEEVATESASNDADSAASEQTEASAEEPAVLKAGVLTMLNITEDEMRKYREAEYIAGRLLDKEGYFKINLSPEVMEKKTKPDKRPEMEVIFYDTLDAMLMALDAGDIDRMTIYYRTGQYLCATNDDLQLYFTFDYEKEQNPFASLVLSGHMSNDFAFLMMEGNEALRDEFSNAIIDMKTDGTMDKLINEQIEALLNGGDVKPVSMPEITGAETIKVAVTGALPPMDYVAADGTPAGFNTAVLAEISQRIGKNIELVVVDSIGRATALSSGTVDAVFWTRTNEQFSKAKEISEDEKSKLLEEGKMSTNDEEKEALMKIREIIDLDEYSQIDMPEGTICTVSYYSDIMVPVKKK